ncbi:MAG: DUF262 domain-containing protein [Lachnospiraceae bacterium]|nr:DUF262 domain-containing protein [Lachnospiraceae bacterium]
MFQIEPKTLRDYVTDESIKMPRFQRSEVWKEKQKFDLMLSICKQYPIGSVILCCEVNENNGITEKWLIDGRQRYSTIQQILLSPDLLWNWAKKALKISDKTSEEEICERFIDYLEVYTNYDKTEHEDDPEVIREIDESSVLSDVDEEAEVDESDDMEAEDSDQTNNEYDTENKGLSITTKRLLDLLLFCKRNKRAKNYGLTQVFNFEKYIKKDAKFSRNFIMAGDTSNRLSGHKTRVFVNLYKDNCKSQKIDYRDKENFLNYIDDEYEFKNAKTRDKYKNTILCNWETLQLEAIGFYEWAEGLLSNSYIGVISVSNASAADEQKIFSLINSNGTPLNAAQILSAKPAWNEPIYNLDQSRRDSIKQVYKYLHNDDVDLEKCVKWDLPACLFNEVNNGDILFPFSLYKSDESKIGKAITLGFKILSGLYLGKVTKDAYDELGNNKNMNNSDFSDFVITLNEMLTKMGGMTYFQTLSSWKLTLSSLIGENATVFFMLAAYYMYMESGRANAGTSAYRIFEKNVFIVLDNIIVEYINSGWKGSSDSLLASKLKNIKSTYKSSELLKAYPTDDWLKVLDEIMDQGTIAGKDIKFDLIKPLVAHYYCIKAKRCSVTYNYTAEFDHIIPQKAFSSSGLDRKEVKRDSIYNIGLLPKGTNASKNDRTLNEISGNTAIVNAVIDYEEIEEKKFGEFSSVLKWEQLKKYRGKKIKEAFKINREEFLIGQ